jgi:hypothetical protein
MEVQLIRLGCNIKTGYLLTLFSINSQFVSVKCQFCEVLLQDSTLLAIYKASRRLVAHLVWVHIYLSHFMCK